MRFKPRPQAPPKPEELFDRSTIDIVAIAPDGSTVELIVVNDSPWTGSDGQVLSLQEKVNSYVSYALDGPLHKAYEDTFGHPWRIVIVDRQGSLDERTEHVVAHMATVVRGCGGDLIVRNDR